MSGHVHEWGRVEYARFTGNPHVKCICGAVSLDLEDAGTRGEA